MQKNANTDTHVLSLYKNNVLVVLFFVFSFACLSTHVANADTFPYFAVDRGGTTQTVTTNVVTLVDFTNKEFDSAGYFDLSTDRYQPLVSGIYKFEFRVQCAPPAFSCRSRIQKNGTSISNALYYATSSANNLYAFSSTLVFMNGTTDYVDAYTSTGGTSISGATANTKFSGNMLVTQVGSTGTTSTSTSQSEYINLLGFGFFIFLGFSTFVIYAVTRK